MPTNLDKQGDPSLAFPRRKRRKKPPHTASSLFFLLPSLSREFPSPGSRRLGSVFSACLSLCVCLFAVRNPRCRRRVLLPLSGSSVSQAWEL